MLKERTEELCAKMDDLMNVMVKETFDVYAMQHATSTELKVIQEALDCWDMCKKISVEQAAVLDELNRKMDILLERSKEA